MRRGVTLVIALAAAWYGAGLATAAAAVPGHALDVESHCGGGPSIGVEPDPALAGAVAIEGAAGSVGSTDGIVRVTAACGHSGGSLVIRTPPAFPITFHLDGDGTLTLGDLAGPLELHLAGDVGVQAGALGGPVVLDNGGDGDAHVGLLGGPVQVTTTGSGDLVVGRINTPALAINLSGSGDARLGDGAIGALRAVLAGSGDLVFNGTIEHGSVSSTGSGDTTIGRVTGALTRSQLGSGDITIRSDGGYGGTAAVTGAPRIDVEHGADGSVQTVVIPSPPRIAFRHGSDDTDRSAGAGGGGSFTHLVLLVVVGSGAYWWWRRRRTRRVPPSSPRISDPNHASIATLADRMEAVARRIARLEAVVTSNTFHLHRQFRDLGD